MNSVSSGILINSGHLLENLIFIALRSEEEELIQSESGQIAVVPVWRFLLKEIYSTTEKAERK